MFLSLMTGLPLMLLCLALQALMVAISLRQYARFHHQLTTPSLSGNVILLALVMLLMLLGNFLQMAIWAGLFMLLGEFEQFSRALYFSGVTFATLGYGDVLLSERWALLGPLEAANGILMFGVSTAVMAAAVSDAIKRHAHRIREAKPK